MKAEQIALIERQYLQKRLLEEFGLPRFSLFYFFVRCRLKDEAANPKSCRHKEDEPGRNLGAYKPFTFYSI